MADAGRSADKLSCRSCHRPWTAAGGSVAWGSAQYLDGASERAIIGKAQLQTRGKRPLQLVQSGGNDLAAALSVRAARLAHETR